jgi:hypothetical protein
MRSNGDQEAPTVDASFAHRLASRSLPYDQHRTLCLAHDLVDGGPEERPVEAIARVRTHHDEVGVPGLRHPQDLARRTRLRSRE